jgi:hypothetical protein
MIEGDSAGVFIDESVGWTGDIIRIRYFQTFGKTLDPDGFSTAQIPIKGNDHPMAQQLSDGRAEVIGRFGGVRDIPERPFHPLPLIRFY